MADSVTPTPNPPSPRPEARRSRRELLGPWLDRLSWVVLLSLGLFLVFRETGGPTLGTEVKTHTLSTVQGNQELVSFPPATQRPVLVKVFASWCGACKRSVWVEELTDLGEPGQLDFVAVSVDDTIEAARQAQSSWPIKTPVLFDVSGTFSRDYNIQVLPTYLLIDKDGRIQRVTSGLPGPLDLRAWSQAAQRSNN
jgi:thiol-disulfide isomerase/thioredoxin